MAVRSKRGATTARTLISSLVLVVSACAEIPSVQTCVDAWNDSTAPAEAVRLFGVDQSTTRVIVSRWHDSEVKWDESGCRITVTDANTAAVVGVIHTNAEMAVDVIGPGSELHDWLSQRSEYAVVIAEDGTLRE